VTSYFSQWVAGIHMPFSKKRIDQDDYEHMLSVLKVGDVISTKTRGELSNVFIPGFWSHVAIYSGNGRVIEATTQGVVETNLAWFLFSKDYCAASRPNFLNEDQKWLVIDYCKRQIGKPYDYSFHTSDIDKFYCSEIVYHAFKFVLGQSPFKLKVVLGQETVAPSDFYNATKLFSRMYLSKSVRS
jgi:uncharacterized protein YycO